MRVVSGSGSRFVPDKPVMTVNKEVHFVLLGQLTPPLNRFFLIVVVALRLRKILVLERPFLEPIGDDVKIFS